MIHYRILYGCDDRFSIVTKTVMMCYKYFDTIRIINCGPSILTDKLIAAGLPENCSVETFHGFYGDLEPVRRKIVRNIDPSDWLLWLDSDERPSPCFLKNIREDVRKLENEGYNCCRFPWCGHLNNTKADKKVSDFPQTWEECSVKPVFAAKRLLKMSENWTIKTNFGMHEDFVSKNEKYGYLPRPVYHLKTRLQEKQSLLFSLFGNPLVHVNPIDIDKVLSSKEFYMLEQFKKTTSVRNSNELSLVIKNDIGFKSELKNLLTIFSKSEIFSFKAMANILDEDINLDTPEFECREDCCTYD